jgi:CubicO group peptidase (beta-lactamase class C family)
MTDRRRRLLEVAQAEGRLTSVVGTVFDRYGAVWAGVAGDVPDGVHGQYRIGSITKTMTAALVLQARDAGLLSLDDRLGRRLGDDVGYADATLRQLLAHTSGMQSEPVGDWWERTRGTDVATLLARNDGSGQVGPPGEYHYSNLGYALLGEVASRAFGAPWRRLVVDRLLAPLGMRRTSYLPRPGAQAGWSIHPFTGVRVHEPLTDTAAMAPAGQLWSTLEDLIVWGQFLAGSRPDVLAPSSLEEMRTPVTEEYGLGLRQSLHAGGVLVGHTGSMPGFLAALLVDPGSGIGTAVLTNATTGVDPLALAVSLIEGDPEGADASPPPWVPTVVVPAPVEGVPGLWFWGNTAFEARWHNDGLDLRPLSPGARAERFELVDGRLRGVAGYHRREVLAVERDPAGQVTHLVCATFVYTRTPYDPAVRVPGGHPDPGLG